jgi:integrase/recombinase XerD
MVAARASRAGMQTSIGCHVFRSTGMTDFLSNGGTLEKTQRIAGHSDPRTTQLYDRRNDEVELAEVARIGI